MLSLAPLYSTPIPCPFRYSPLKPGNGPCETWWKEQQQKNQKSYLLPISAAFKMPIVRPRTGMAGVQNGPLAVATDEEEEEEQEENIERCLLGVWGKEKKMKNLSELSTWDIGGPCRYFLEVNRPAQLISAIRYCHRQSMPFLIVGKGSNCLFDDRGFDGCVVLNRINTIDRIGHGVFRVGSGYPFNKLGVQCSCEGYSGLEFAGGVPGTVGGAVFMNAGANGQETADAIGHIEILTTNGNVRVLRKSDLMFGYRKSTFQEMDELAAILAVTFRLKPSKSAHRRLQGYMDRRSRTQPIREKSAGSVFQNPSGSDMSAGELIEKAGLKGFKLGGAKVSEVHANFFINFNRATSGDMLELINIVKEIVDEKFGIKLKQEVCYIPYNVF